jgi:hypothetical protein
MKELGKKVCEAVESGTLVEPFNAAMIRAACPGWSDRTYHVFLAEHTAATGNTNELFERVSFVCIAYIGPVRKHLRRKQM